MPVKCLNNVFHGHAQFRTASFRELIRHLPMFSGRFMFSKQLKLPTRLLERH
jgi:hypothetical protein